MWRRWLIIAATLAVVALVQLWWRQQQDEIAPGADAQTQLQYRLQDFTLRLIGADGTERMRIMAPLMIDQGEGLPSRLTRPVLISTNHSPRWEITAERALLWRQTHEAEFIGHVVVNTLDPADSTRLETSYLRFNLENKTIHSPELVTITRPGLRLRGIGLLGDIDTARYFLHSDIQATYVDQ